MTLVFTTTEQATRVVKAYLSRPNDAVYFDTETSGKRYREDKLASIQLQQGDRQPVIFDVRDRPEVVQALAPIFEKLLLVGHNLKFDLNWMRQYGIQAKRVFDTQIAEQVIYGRGLGGEDKHNDLPMNLKAVAKRRGIEMSKEEREWFYKPAPLHERPEWSAPFPDEQVEYMAKDITVLRPIAQAQMADIKERGLMEVFKIEMRCLPALVEMEYTGIHIDVENWRAFIRDKEEEAGRLEGEALSVIGSAILDKRIRDYDAALAEWEAGQLQRDGAEEQLRDLFDRAGGKEALGVGWGEYKKQGMSEYKKAHPWSPRPKLETDAPNLGSPSQLIAGLEALGIPIPMKPNDKGVKVKTTDRKSLEPLATQYPVIKTLLAWRAAQKLARDFGENILAFRDENDRIHPEFRQIGADTGRMSCTKPNFQQIPGRGPDGKRLRKCVTAAPGYKLVVADFSNIEARIVANLTNDQAMKDAFARGVDLHSDTARRVFGLEGVWDKKRAVSTKWKGEVTYREVGKMLNFLILYGGSAYKMAFETGIPVKEAERIIATYFREYQQVEQWAAQRRREVRTALASRTLAGRKRYFTDPGPEPDSSAYRGRYKEYEDALAAWKKQWGKIERESLNSPIQGLSADISKLAVALYHERPHAGKLIVVVHDELVVEVAEDQAIEEADVLADAMKDACDAYLKVSPVPRPEPTISDTWEHD